jgi:fructose-bisphosphate aldolase class II
MPLLNPLPLFQKALAGKYALGAFNVNNMEIVQGILAGAKNKKAPVILQVSAGARKYASPIYLRKLVEAAVEDNPEIPIALHLDHGEDFAICQACVDSGFTSVMIDGSKFPLEENIRLTKEVVDYAHAKGVAVEGELGKLAGIEDAVSVADREATFTDPDEAVRFVQETGVDSLAIAIGTSHGAYKFKGDAQLDFERLKKISEKLPGFPLVLHGASSVLPEFVSACNAYGGKIPGAKGVPEAMIATATKWGIAKVNIDTDIRLAVTATIRQYLAEHPADFDPRQYLKPAREAIRQMVEHKIEVLGCGGKI